MERTILGFLVLNSRANGWLACGPHGARRIGDSWYRAPEQTGRLACGPHGACQDIGELVRPSNVSTVGRLPAKKITLCRAGTGRVIPASNRRPTGFAGNPHGAYPRFPSRT